MRWTRWVALASLFVVALGAIVVSCSSNKAAQKGEMTSEQKVARGAYLVSFVGCEDCHTPGSLYGFPDSTRRLSGSELGWQGPWGVSYPRNLTPDQETGIGSWTEDQIVTAIRAGRRPDGSPVLPPMPWPDLAHLTNEDAYAIAAFLKSIPAVSHKAPDRIPPGVQLTGPALVFPPPPAWDAKNLPPQPPDTTKGSAG